MIRRNLENRIRRASETFPVVTITGPRQSGKSTLCKMLFPKYKYRSLEAPDIQRFAQTDPRRFLGQLTKGAILDEIQRCPELLSYIQTIVDEDKSTGKWILTGSQNLTLLESVSQSLAGRTAVLHLLPLTRDETRKFPRWPEDLDQTLLMGGYPRIFDQNLTPDEWITAYVATYLERDVRTILKITDLTAFHRFVELCAGRTGQLLNCSNLSSDAGISLPTVKSWLTVLEASFLVFRLPPLMSNIRKRLVKMPKLYFYDTGLVCWLLGIRTAEQLANHPLRGAIFETWVISEIIKHRTNQGLSRGTFFYRDRHGTEIDLIIEHANKMIAVEAKSGQTITEDMIRSALQRNKLLSKIKPTNGIVAYGGETRQDLQGTSFLPWEDICKHNWE